jgi:hypothetical protein
MNILLDYFFPIAEIESTPSASTSFLKQACLVVKPKNGVPTGTITLCTTTSAVAALTDNVEATQLFNAGMSKVYILPMDDLDLAAALEGHESDFFTLLISSDFSDAEIEAVVEVAEVAASVKVQDITYTAKTAGVDGNDITIIYNDTKEDGSAEATLAGSDISVAIESGVTTAATIKAAIEAAPSVHALVSAVIDSGDETDVQASFTPAEEFTGGVDEVLSESGMDVGEFEGVVGVSSTDDTFLAAQAAIANRCAFHAYTQGAKNMCYAFGKMLSNSLNWKNQQYISMPYADDVATLGDAEALFDDDISFVITDDEYSHRLAMFCAGGKAIVAPYIEKNLKIDLQSEALSYISGNQPAYTKKHAALLEDELQKVINEYIDDQWIESGIIELELEEDNYIASGYINISEPKALWRVFGEMQETL